MRGKLSEPNFDVWLFSNPGENVQKARKAVGQIYPIIFLLFMTFSPRLETNNTLQCSSDSFPRLGTYILCVENLQNYISTHSCLPIAGRLFQNVRKFHGPRISEYNIRINTELVLALKKVKLKIVNKHCSFINLLYNINYM